MNHFLFKRRDLWTRAAFVVLLLLPVLLAALTSFLNPLFEPPDELLHYQFVRTLIDERELPVQQLDGPLSQYHQPPLYYVIGALLTATVEDDDTIPARNPHWTSYQTDQIHRDNKAQFLPANSSNYPYLGTTLFMHALRLWSLLLTIGTVLLIWLSGRTLWPDDPHKQLLFLAIATLVPMFIYIGGSANNDNLIIFFAALIFWLSIRALKEGFSWPLTIILGLVWGLAILSKMSGLILAAPWAGGLLWVSWQRKDWRLLITRSITIGAIALLLSAWWFVRNVQIYNELSGLEQMLDIWGERQAAEFTELHLGGTLGYAWSSFWGRFGYGQIVLPRFIYWIYAGLVLLALIGLVKFWLAKGQRPSWKGSLGAWFVAVCMFMAFVTGFFYFMLRNPSGANGRYIFPALPAFAFLMVVGLTSFNRWRRLLPLLLLSLAGLAVFSLAFFVPWSYSPPRLLTEEKAMQQISMPHNLTWEQGIRLLGTKLEPKLVSDGPDSEVTLTACWRAERSMDQDHTFFVHLLDADLNPLGQRNTHPGLGNLPTSTWDPGDVFCDNYQIPLEEEILTTPIVADVEIGFYEPGTSRRLQAHTETNQAVDFVVIDHLKLTPSHPEPIPQPAVKLETVRFEQGVQLTGYSASADILDPGDAFRLGLWWSASGPLDSDYQIFAHLLTEQGEIIAQADGPPRDGSYASTYWGAGETIVDERQFTIPAESPPGGTTVRVGLYRLEDGRRLARLDGTEALDYVDIAGPVISE